MAPREPAVPTAPVGPDVVVVGGYGRVGGSLATALQARGWSVARCSRRREGGRAGMSHARVVVLAVPDRLIPGVADELRAAGCLAPEQVLLHCAGAYPAATVLGGVGGEVRAVGTLHPLRSFVTPVAPEVLRGTTFAIEGDQAAREAARELIAAVGGAVLEVEAAMLPLYHAAAVMASNYVVALVDAARHLLQRAASGEGEPLAALLPLLESVVASLRHQGLPHALTGPLVRGDVATVARHLDALSREAPKAAALYRAVGRWTAAVAAQQGGGAETDLAACRALLEGSDEEPGSMP